MFWVYLNAKFATIQMIASRKNAHERYTTGSNTHTYTQRLRLAHGFVDTRVDFDGYRTLGAGNKLKRIKNCPYLDEETPNVGERAVAVK